jgi:hypothetical protein
LECGDLLLTQPLAPAGSATSDRRTVVPKHHLVAEVLKIRFFAYQQIESLLIYSGYAAALSYVHYGRCGYFVFDAVPPRLRNLTPAPPPFSSMNPTPAACSALCIFFPFSLRRPSGPSLTSSRFIAESHQSEI